MFDHMVTDDLIRIAFAGGGFTLKASTRSTDDLIRIAHAASSKGARVTFAGLRARSTDDFIRIGAAGKGSVDFID